MTGTNPAAAPRRDPEELYRRLCQQPGSNQVYPLTPEQWSQYQRKPRWASLSAERELAVYVHFPFCESKCAFCEYATLPNMTEAAQDSYVDALLREVDLYAGMLGNTGTEYFGFDIGGGTPTLLTEGNMRRIWRAVSGTLIRGRTSADWTPNIETTAVIAARRPERLSHLPELGFRRLSMGIQTMDPQLLATLNRRSQESIVYADAIANARRAGFEKINADIMFGLPGQSLQSFHSNVEYVGRILHPEHITLYNTRYVRGVLPGCRRPAAPDPVVLYRTGYETLRACGYYAPFGSSYFSSSERDPNCSSYLLNRHTKFGSFVGIGAGAQSQTSLYVAYNCYSDDGATAQAYQDGCSQGAPVQRYYELPWQELVVRHLALPLCFHGCLDYSRHAAKTGIDIKAEFARELDFLRSQGLLRDSGTELYMTERGYPTYYAIIALFYPRTVQDAMLAALAPVA